VLARVLEQQGERLEDLGAGLGIAGADRRPDEADLVEGVGDARGLGDVGGPSPAFAPSGQGKVADSTFTSS